MRTTDQSILPLSGAHCKYFSSLIEVLRLDTNPLQQYPVQPRYRCPEHVHLSHQVHNVYCACFLPDHIPLYPPPSRRSVGCQRTRADCPGHDRSETSQQWCSVVYREELQHLFDKTD